MLNAAEIGRIFLLFVTIKMNYDVNKIIKKLRSVESGKCKTGVVERKSGKTGENCANTGVLPTKAVDNSVDNVE